MAGSLNLGHVVGPAGQGVASGGTTGQYLKKASGTDYDTAWESFANATQSAAGMMSAADKAKLDGLPASAAVPGSIAIIVDGDTAGTAVAPGQYAYIKNNTHGLAEGLYKNKSSSAFPTSGGTANSTVFEAVSGGLGSEVAALNSKFTWKQLATNLVTGSSFTPTGYDEYLFVLRDQSNILGTSNIPSVISSSGVNIKFITSNNTQIELYKNASGNWTVTSGYFATVYGR